MTPFAFFLSGRYPCPTTRTIEFYNLVAHYLFSFRRSTSSFFRLAVLCAVQYLCQTVIHLTPVQNQVLVILHEFVVLKTHLRRSVAIITIECYLDIAVQITLTFPFYGVNGYTDFLSSRFFSAWERALLFRQVHRTLCRITPHQADLPHISYRTAIAAYALTHEPDLFFKNHVSI